MKKSLHILLAATLCLLIFCAACGKDGTIDNNTDKTPDNTPVTDPDTTLPDSTADDKQNDITPPDSTADDKQNDITPPDTTADDKQNDVTPPDSTGDDKQGDNDTADPAGDNKEPVIIEPYEMPTIDYANAENTTALQNYYAFLTGEATAYDFLHEKTTSFNDITKNGDVPINWFGLVDFGADGIFEVYMTHGDSRYSNVVLFFDNGNLYVDYIATKGTEPLHLFGIVYVNAGSRTGNYWVLTVSAENGLEFRDIAGVYNEYTDDWSGKVYYISSTYENGVFLPAEKKIVSKDEYEAYTSPIDGISYIQTFKFSISKVQEVFLSLK